MGEPSTRKALLEHIMEHPKLLRVCSLYEKCLTTFEKENEELVEKFREEHPQVKCYNKEKMVGDFVSVWSRGGNSWKTALVLQMTAGYVKVWYMDNSGEKYIYFNQKNSMKCLNLTPYYSGPDPT